jgi:chitin disaccharide deacetylase
MTHSARPWLERDVLLCADDFAYNASCSHAIAQLAATGKIQATSAMVLSPRWSQDASMLHGSRGNVSVGLHLDWTSTYAVAVGHGMGLGPAMLRAALHRFDIEKSRRVIAHQLDLFEAYWGAPPDHIDGHQHVQQFAGIREALVKEIELRYPSQKPWLRISCPAPGDFSLKSSVISAMGAARLLALAQTMAIPSRRHLSGLYDFQGGARRYAHMLRHWQNNAPAGSVIMCHPATAAEIDDSIGLARMCEYEVLASLG